MNLLLRLAYMNLRTQMEYRFNFWFLLTVKMMGYASGYAMIWLILNRFRGVGGWSIPEVMTLWALVQLSYTLAAPFFFHSMGKLDHHVVTRNFDHFLVQPLHPVANLIARNFSWTYSSQIVLNAAVLFISLSQANMPWSVGRIAFLFLTILGGVAFQSFVFLFGAAMNFRWLHSGRSVSSNLRLMIDFTQYPLSIYPKGLQSFLTFVVPVGMINYYPCLYLFGRGNDAWFYPWLSWIAPTVAIGVGLLGLIFWQHGVNSYQSSGS